MAARSYRRLLSPGRIGPLEVRNRIVMPAMDQNSCTDDGELTDLNLAHYEARARGGAGLLILETSAVAYPVGATSRHQPALSDDRYIPGLARLAEVTHRHGAKTIVQMCHHGKTAGVDALEGRAQLVPSVPIPQYPPDLANMTMDELMRMAAANSPRPPEHREAAVDDLAWVVEQFAGAAARVQAAGLDGVEIHAAHGYLISTFLSPLYNRRTDAYGATTGGRTRLLAEVVAAVRARCGDGFAIVVRLDGTEHHPDGITPAMAAEHAVVAQDAGADAIHVSANSTNAMSHGFTEGPLPWQPGQYVDLARSVKAAVTVPVIAVGRIAPDRAEDLLGDETTCDFVAMGRQLLADPQLPNRLAAGRPDLVRTCINCFVCVAENFWDAAPVCAVNADLGHYDRPPPEPAPAPRHVVVIGGGPGGMEAARVAAERGHRVTLVEKSKHLGGTARFSSLTTPMNAELVRYLSSAIAEVGVTVRLGETAGAATVAALGADVVVVATGARRSRPDVSGADLDHVLSGDDLRALLTGDAPSAGKSLGLAQRAVVAAGRRLKLTDDMAKVRELSKTWMPLADDVAVIGGGLVGLELAEFLAERGRRVTVVESSAHVGKEMAHPRRLRAVHEAEGHGVRIERNASLVEIGSGTVTFEREGERHTVSAGHVILAAGVEPDTRFADELRAAGHEVHVVGDAAEVGYIQGAISSANEIARKL